MYFLPFAFVSIMLIIFLKKTWRKKIDLIPDRIRYYSLMVPVAEKILIRRRVIDLKNKTSTEVSLEATPEQVRAIFRN